MRREIVGDDAVLLHGIDRNGLRRAGRENVVVLYAVQQNVRSGGALPVQAVTHTLLGRVLRLALGSIAIADVAGNADKVIRVPCQRG